MKLRVLFLVLAFSSAVSHAGAAATNAASPASKPSPWNLEVLSAAPRTFPAPNAKAEGVRGLYYQGLPWKGKETRVFAWYGAPAHQQGQRLPAVVLLHGGGGHAFEDWVRVWNDHGYAALAMSLEGQGETNQRRDPGHEFSGPKRAGIFADIDEPVEDQWFYHAIADAILAHSLLRSYPEIDPDRIGVTGISWGGILTSALAGVDTRLKFAIPFYGCGFLTETPTYGSALARQKSTDKYLALWEPSNYLPKATAPMLFVNGSNDSHFPLNAYAKTNRLPQGPVSVCVRVGMGHGHPTGWAPKEIYAFADSIVKGGEPLARLTPEGRKDSAVAVKSSAPIKQATLVYTTDPKDWVQCKWEEAPATVDAASQTARVELPKGTRGYFINVTDDRGLLGSTIMEIVQDWIA